jgi:GTP-binding protein HflX
VLVHVVDASNPDWPRQMQAVDATLADLHLEHKPRLIAFNKCDALAEEPPHAPGELCVSARSGSGLEALKEALCEVLPHS